MPEGEAPILPVVSMEALLAVCGPLRLLAGWLCAQRARGVPVVGCCVGRLWFSAGRQTESPEPEDAEESVGLRPLGPAPEPESITISVLLLFNVSVWLRSSWSEGGVVCSADGLNCSSGSWFPFPSMPSTVSSGHSELADRCNGRCSGCAFAALLDESDRFFSCGLDGRLSLGLLLEKQ